MFTLGDGVDNKVLASYVIRASSKGQAHGGLAIVDLDNASVEKDIPWSELDIDFDGRGGERGLRGVACLDDCLFFASHDTLYKYDKNFNSINKWSHSCLRNMHEIDVFNNKIFITSTGIDSVVIFDFKEEVFKTIVDFSSFSSNGKVGKIDFKSKFNFKRSDSLHINSVKAVSEKSFYIGGTKCEYLYKVDIKSHKISCKNCFPLPSKNHNAMPLNSAEIIYNDPPRKRTVICNKITKTEQFYDHIEIPEEYIENFGINDKFAKVGFCRGLVVNGDYIIAGCSPANISLFKKEDNNILSNVILSYDKRFAIHGLDLCRD